MNQNTAQTTQNAETLKRTGFLFYESYYKAFLSLEPEQAYELLQIFCEYALYGKEKKKIADKVVNGFWECLKPSLEKGRINAKNRTKKENTEPKPEQKEEKREVKEQEKRYSPLAEYEVVEDCNIDDFDEKMLRKAFEKSSFLRKTFKTTSKIKRFYEKIKQGAYEDVQYGEPQTATLQTPYYTDEELKNALVDFSTWEG